MLRVAPGLRGQGLAC